MAGNSPVIHSNGHRTNRLNTLMIVIQTIGILLVLFVLWQQRGQEMFTVQSPQKVLTPIIHLNEAVKISSYKCNKTDMVLSVGNATYWIREQPNWLRIDSAYLPVDRGVPFSPGCVEKVFNNEPPQGVTEGVWYIGGTNTVKSPEGKEQTVSWRTETFTVVK